MEIYLGTGRRKCAVARVRLMAGTGQITVNKKDVRTYFHNIERIIRRVYGPLRLTNTENNYDVHVNMHGGGYVGQAGALVHGLSRALEKVQPELRPILKKAGFLRRDARVVERKKYGQKGARARFQFSKR
jgi:small subunit ribosomal protein S9